MVIEKFDQPDVRLDYYGGTAGTYAGLDRFGRVIQQLWQKGTSTELDKFTYTYDYNSNRTTKAVGASAAGKDEKYAYDGLSRLGSYERGTLGGGRNMNEPRTLAEKDTTMKRTHLIALLVGIVAVGIFAADASAFYNAATGTWMQRDPAGYVDGTNLYQYVRSNSVQRNDPLGLWEDHTKACCKYTGETNVLSSVVITRKFMTEEKNNKAIVLNDPKEVCNCAVMKNGGFAWQVKLEKAEWGSCCWCRMYKLRARNAEGNDIGWPSHVIFLIECDNYKSASGDFLPGPAVGIGPFKFVSGSTAPASSPASWHGYINSFTVKGKTYSPTYAVVDKVEVSCDAFDSVWQKMQAWQKSPPGYWTGSQDCYWYVSTMINVGSSAGYIRPD